MELVTARGSQVAMGRSQQALQKGNQEEFRANLGVLGDVYLVRRVPGITSFALLADVREAVWMSVCCWTTGQVNNMVHTAGDVIFVRFKTQRKEL